MRNSITVVIAQGSFLIGRQGGRKWICASRRKETVLRYTFRPRRLKTISSGLFRTNSAGREEAKKQPREKSPGNRGILRDDAWNSEKWGKNQKKKKKNLNAVEERREEQLLTNKSSREAGGTIKKGNYRPKSPRGILNTGENRPSAISTRF